jgi:hypothetical protein
MILLSLTILLMGGALVLVLCPTSHRSRPVEYNEYPDWLKPRRPCWRKLR